MPPTKKNSNKNAGVAAAADNITDDIADTTTDASGDIKEMDLMINDVLNDAVSNDVSASSGAAATADTPITPPEKKRPGRPKKRIMTEAIKISGVVEVPNDPESKVEMVYQNPGMFKSIFALLKAYAAKEIMIYFKHETIEFAAQDHLDNTSILATIDCSKLVHYYCLEPSQVYIKRNEIETILHNVRKCHARLTIILKINYTSHIVLQTENSDVGNRNIYEVELCQINRGFNDVFHAEDEYPLSFELPYKHFKEEINSISQLSPLFSIEKNYGEPLSFTFENHKTKTIMNSPYVNEDKIKLKSTVDDDDIFAVRIKIDYVKPFANTKLGDVVLLYVARDKKIMFKTHIDDKVCTIRVYTNIIRINPDD